MKKERRTFDKWNIGQTFCYCVTNVCGVCILYLLQTKIGIIIVSWLRTLYVNSGKFIIVFS